jgi:hypothetical protein
LSYPSQNRAIIPEASGEIKDDAPSPLLPLDKRVIEVQLAHARPMVLPLRRLRRSQAKAGTNALPQGTFFLDTDQGPEAFPVRIQEHDRRVTHPMTVGKRQPLGGIEVRQHEGYPSVKLSPERVDDALELRAVGSAR